MLLHIVAQFLWQVQVDLIGKPEMLFPPLRLLRRYIRRADDASVRVNQEQSEDLAMARLGLVLEMKGVDPMLHNIGESYQAALTSDYTA